MVTQKHESELHARKAGKILPRFKTSELPHPQSLKCNLMEKPDVTSFYQSLHQIISMSV